MILDWKTCKVLKLPKIHFANLFKRSKHLKFQKNVTAFFIQIGFDFLRKFCSKVKFCYFRYLKYDPDVILKMRFSIKNYLKNSN